MKFLIDRIWIVTLLCSLVSLGQSIENDTSKTILLILGSGNLNTSIERAEVGFNVYNSKKDVDYIIVSGGCGAHSSSICEATIMADVLIAKGVPETIIYKEEKSKSTAQNYCYSRNLKHSDGTKLINDGDRLFVVSNHWHAMSVSGCFSDKDLVHSKYIIEGDITPKPDHKTDYGAMYENCMNNPNYCKSVLWPKIDAAYSLKDKRRGVDIHSKFIEDILIRGQDSSASYSTIAAALPEFLEDWNSNFDAAYYNKFENLIYIFKGEHYVALKPGSSTIEDGYPKPLNTLFPDLSNYWRMGHWDAAFFNPKTKHSYVFKGDQYLKIPYRKNKLQIVESPKMISDLVVNWPFNWGKGDIDAALYTEATNEVLLYRGQEILRLKFEGDHLIILNTSPQKLSLEWPTEFLGNRN
ncbi:ElyC/SanA/YdcF family protein [Gelidibacter salicanalis]|uniref:YdcF family protein n=1 Tax=Gelidibacter salicanalis TaxID=291193 RepID=A0A934KRV8_9FLAO|nr:ElyC/SanA/YdcF family protein [Gelidibacter salicanalis]MBJ7879528.1 YdcF family protein [Gelidibacter salicanalis]